MRDKALTVVWVTNCQHSCDFPEQCLEWWLAYKPGRPPSIPPHPHPVILCAITFIKIPSAGTVRSDLGYCSQPPSVTTPVGEWCLLQDHTLILLFIFGFWTQLLLQAVCRVIRPSVKTIWRQRGGSLLCTWENEDACIPGTPNHYSAVCLQRHGSF